MFCDCTLYSHEQCVLFFYPYLRENELTIGADGDNNYVGPTAIIDEDGDGDEVGDGKDSVNNQRKKIINIFLLLKRFLK